jgi:hypothetical protein
MHSAFPSCNSVFRFVLPIGNSHALDRSPFLTFPSFLCCKQKDTSPSCTKALKNLASNYSQSVIESYRRNLLNLNYSLATLFLSCYPPFSLVALESYLFLFPSPIDLRAIFPRRLRMICARWDEMYVLGLGHRLSARNAMCKQARHKTLHCIASSRNVAQYGVRHDGRGEWSRVPSPCCLNPRTFSTNLLSSISPPFGVWASLWISLSGLWSPRHRGAG